MKTLYAPTLLFTNGAFVAGAGLLVDESGKIADVITDIREADAHTVVALPGRALLPGFVNAHSHTFQRLIRGKAESRNVSGNDFWSWRGRMYHAAASLDPEDVYDVARMAFLEMAMAGTTTVGEFHYLHTAPDGVPYDDPNLLAKQVIAAAQSIGIRIVLLRTAYLRSGFRVATDPGQTRFFESAAAFLENTGALVDEFKSSAATVSFGVAPHSIRAVPLADLHMIVDWARSHRLPIHMHVAEQVAENRASVEEYGVSPVALLHRESILGPHFTAVHSIHVSSEEIRALAHSQATICSCPTTERNLGDGIIAADIAMQSGIRFALGSDSQAQIAPLEDARQLEYHLRLAQQQRSLLDLIENQAIASRLFDCATVNGSKSLGVPAGELGPGSAADFFTVDLNDLSIAGQADEDLLSTIVFSLERTAVRDVAVQGRLIIRDGRHAASDEVIARYKAVHQKVWRDTKWLVRP